jgi:acyl transferase domain-containing protein
MDPFADTKPRGAFSALLADQDLNHLELVLRRSLFDDPSGPVLPPAYWRERLANVVRNAHLSHTQLQTVHRLYLQIEAYETAYTRATALMPEATPVPRPPVLKRGLKVQ